MFCTPMMRSRCVRRVSSMRKGASERGSAACTAAASTPAVHFGGGGRRREVRRRRGESATGAGHGLGRRLA